MPRVRLASALLVPEPYRGEIDGLRRAMGESTERVPPHLTLIPPINVRTEDVDVAFAVLRRAAANTPTITVTLGPATTFHPVNPVVYLSVGGDDVDIVHALHDAVLVDVFERPQPLEFVPHVTIVESTTPERIDAALVALADYRVDVTFESVHLLKEVDRVWTPIAEAIFRASVNSG